MSNTLHDQKFLELIYIEDNPGDQELLEEYLNDAENFHFRLRHAHSVKEARLLKQEASPDVLLLDLNLIDTIGRETIDAAIIEFSEVPILILTQHSSMDISYYASSRGVVDFLLKGEDFRTEKLTRAILMARARWEVEYAKLQLMQQNLQQSLNKLERSRQLLNHQIFIFSHQIRGPLCTIEGLMNILNDEFDESMRAEVLKHLKETYDQLKSEVDRTIQELEGQVNRQEENLRV